MKFGYVIFLIFLLSLLFIVPTSAQTVVFDRTSGFFGIDHEGNAGFYRLYSELEENDYYVKDSFSIDKYIFIKKSTLKRANIFVIINPMREYSFEERRAILEYVKNGGKLLLICDNPECVNNINKIAWMFGGEFLGYYLGNSVYLVKFNSLFYSPMALKVEKANFTVNVSSKAYLWDSLFKIGEEVGYSNYTVFAVKSFGKGRVAFLGDKDFMSNFGITKLNNSMFALTVFKILKQGIKKTKMENKYVRYSLKELTVKVLGKPSIVSFMIENLGEDQVLEIIIPDYLKDFVVPIENNVTLHKDEKKILRLIVKWSDKFGVVNDYIIIKRTINKTVFFDYIPLKVVWDENKDNTS